MLTHGPWSGSILCVWGRGTQSEMHWGKSSLDGRDGSAKKNSLTYASDRGANLGRRHSNPEGKVQQEKLLGKPCGGWLLPGPVPGGRVSWNI